MVNLENLTDIHQYVAGPLQCATLLRLHHRDNMSLPVHQLQESPNSPAVEQTSSLKIVKTLYPQPLCLRTLGAPKRNHIVSRLCRCQSLWDALLILMQTTAYCNFGGRQMPLFPQANGLSLLWNDKWYQSVGLRASVRKCSAGIWAMRPRCQQKASRQIWQCGRSVDLFCVFFFFLFIFIREWTERHS